MGLKDIIHDIMFIDEEDEEITPEEIAEEEKKARELSSQDKKTSRSSFRNEEVKPDKSIEKAAPLENRYSVTNPGTFKMLVIEPKSFDECPKLVDNLRGRRPIVINLEKIETETAKKIFDFLNGATYALEGNVQRVSNNIFIFTPPNVKISANQGESGFSFISDSIVRR